MTVALASCPPPRVDVPPTPAPLPVALYHDRLAAARAQAARLGFDVLAVYGDREHSANLAYLTGFDPRFEEALLALTADGRGTLLVGNECMGYLPDPGLGLAVELFQEFSLMGQARGESRPLGQILEGAGVGRGARVGCVGWKCYGDALVGDAHLASDVPSYVVDALRELAGGGEQLVNATGIFSGVVDGLRLINEPEQIVHFEYAAGVTSAGVAALLDHIAEGVREDQLERHLDSRGLPLSCHRMVGFGAKAQRGLASASANVARRGDTFTTAFGVAGALTCRAGAVATGPADLPEPLRDFFPRFAANYFAVVRAWYQALRVGTSAGEVFAAADAARDPALYEFAVNPGHYLHLDEWVNSPFAAGSDVTLRSGMALQMDIIPVSSGPFCYVNAEDGVVLADDHLRGELARRWPDLIERVERRRSFMGDALGIVLDESVLPLSDTSGWLPPYALDLGHALAWRA